jgi:hypothetical protein
MDMIHLMECYMMMVQDQGASADSIDFRLTCDQVIKLDLTSLSELRRADKLLGVLTLEEREILSVGDQDDWEPIFKKIGPEYEMVHRILDVLFENMMWGDEVRGNA